MAAIVDSWETMVGRSNDGGDVMSMNASVSTGKHAPRHVFKENIKTMSPQERRVQVAAARLRVTLDDRLGRQTPDAVKALAKQPF